MDWQRAAIAYVVFAVVVAVIQELAPVVLTVAPNDWKLKLQAELILPALLVAALWAFGRFRPKKSDQH